MNRDDAPGDAAPADLPEMPKDGAGSAGGLDEVGSRPSSVKAAGGPIASHDEDLPFPLPADWFERKAKKQAEAAAKAAAEAAEQEAKAAAQTVQAQPSSGGREAPVVRQRPSPELLRSAAHAASGEGRMEAYQNHVLSADASAAAHRWMEAASAYEAAARKAPNAEIAAQLAAKAVAARSRSGRLRRVALLALALGVLGGTAAGGWWMLSHRSAGGAAPADQGLPGPTVARRPAEDNNLSAKDKAKAYAIQVQLVADEKDADKTWTSVQTEARAALAQPGIDQAVVSAILQHATAEVDQLTKDFDAVEASRSHDAAKALALAAAFRTTHQRAGDYGARLPLPGRLLVGNAPLDLEISIDGMVLDAAAAANPDGVPFCRSAQHPVTITAHALGYFTVTREIPATPATPTDCSITMVEVPQWTFPAPSTPSTWMSLVRTPGSQLVAASSSTIAVIDPASGQVRSALHAGDAIVGAHPGSYTWSAFIQTADPAHFILGTTTGSLCDATADGLHITLLGISEHPVALADSGILLYHLNAPVQYVTTTPRPPKIAFGTSLEERDKIPFDSDLSAISAGRVLWTMPLSGDLPPFVRAHGEQVIAIDDKAVHVFDQEGKALSTLALPSRRQAAVVDFDDGAVVIVPCAKGMTLLRDTGGGAYHIGSFPSDVRLIAASHQRRADGTREERLLAYRGSTLTLSQVSATSITELWSMDCQALGALMVTDMVEGMPAVIDAHHALLLLDASDHHVVRRLNVPDGLLAPPLLIGRSLVVADRLGAVRAYPLTAPSSARNPAP